MILERNIPTWELEVLGQIAPQDSLQDSAAKPIQSGKATCAANQGSPHTALKGSRVAFKCQPT